MNIFLNSKERVSGDFFNPTFNNNFNHTFFNLEENETLRVYPSRFSILNDFENVNSYNNTFNLFYVLEDGTEQNQEITVPIGYYNVYSLADKLQDILKGFFESAFADGTVFNVNIFFNEDSNKYQFSISGTGDLADPFFNLLSLQFIFDNVEDSLAQFLGFDASNYQATKTQTGNTVNYTFESVQSVNFVFQPELNVYMNIIKNNLESSLGGFRTTNLFFNLNQDVAKNQYIEFINPSELFKADCISNFSTVEFLLLDALGRPILFKSGFSLVLTFEKIKMDNLQKQILEKIENLEKMEQLKMLLNNKE